MLSLQVVEALQRGAAHESLVCCAAYILGEYGRSLKDLPVQEQFTLLHERFPAVSAEAKVGPCLALTCIPACCTVPMHLSLPVVSAGTK